MSHSSIAYHAVINTNTVNSVIEAPGNDRAYYFRTVAERKMSQKPVHQNSRGEGFVVNETAGGSMIVRESALYSGNVEKTYHKEYLKSHQAISSRFASCSKERRLVTSPGKHSVASFKGVFIKSIPARTARPDIRPVERPKAVSEAQGLTHLKRAGKDAAHQNRNINEAVNVAASGISSASSPRTAADGAHINRSSQADVEKIADKVYEIIERKIRIERERRGL